ncbi:MAG: hypothetical protein RLZZ522_566 [Verrucomicrobiota bacterium]
MNANSKLLALALAACLPQATAHPPPPKVGFVRIVNAVAQGKNTLQLLIDGEVMNADGYMLGDVTGGIGLQPGTHEVTFKRTDLKDGVTRINVVADHTTTLIPFAELVPATDEVPAQWAIRILRLKQMAPETKRTATFVSVSQTPEHEVEISDPKGTWTKVFVKRLTLKRTPILYPEGYVPLRSKTGRLPAIPVGEPGNYVVVLYDDAAGKTQALNLQDYKYLSAD